MSSYLGLLIESKPSSSFLSSFRNMSTPDVGRLDLSDSDSEDLFASPTKATQKPNPKSGEGISVPLRGGESKYDAEQTREDALKREFKSVQSVNEVIEGVISSLECAKGNMDVSSCIIKSDQQKFTHGYRRFRRPSQVLRLC